jgi:hypothetical protein
MHLSLLILGVILTLAGAAAVAFGIPINEFGLGNTLIIAGTTGFVGGLILVGLSQAVRQLRRISESLMYPDAGMPRIGDPPEAVHSPFPAPAAAAPRIPFPPKPDLRPRTSTLPPEARLDIAPSIATEEPRDREPPAFTRNAPEPRVIPDREEAPLSPAESRFSAKREEKDELAEDLLATAFSRLDVALREAPPAVEAPKKNSSFETMWAERRRAAEAEMHPPAPVEAPEPEPEPVEEPEDFQEAQQEETEAPYAVSILKSGVVDGMAYTLYSDGSIEAEMQQGTMRFVSITELRAYLEKSSS